MWTGRKGLLALPLILMPGLAAAFGLGHLELQSHFNEPLRAEIQLLDTEGLDIGQLNIGLAPRVDFERAEVERSDFLSNLKFDSLLAEDGSGRVLVTSQQPVQERYLNFLVDARWPAGRVVRMYTLLLDSAGSGSSGMDNVAGYEEPVPATRQAEAVEPPPESQQASIPESPEEPLEAEYQYQPEALVPGASYLVKRDETLWSIARRVRPQGSTIAQTMMHIQRLNPQAFIDEDINWMMAGYTLRMPTVAEFSEMLSAETDQQPGEEGISGIDEPADQGSAGQGRLQITGLDAALDAGADTASLQQLRWDNQELQARIGSIEEQLLTLQSLLSLKDDQIAELQAALEQATAAVTNTPDLASALRTTLSIVAGLLKENLLYAGAALGVLALLLLLWLRRSRGRTGPEPEEEGGEWLADLQEPDDEFLEVEAAQDEAGADHAEELRSESEMAREEAEEADGDLVFAADGDETSTKLDLARAYLDMGDDTRARDLLAEVEQDGTAEQQQEARQLIDGIG